ncbi:TonB-dependent receptor domain-containing protein [Novosphingobium album (ex Liu et al. 2023)]|uniref:TonB-dependent receptor n=1 Tax=Novosphingobium album (ex Liu et al. 2023) TaxID=3031130 RepID=A0ABT5WVL1_9SPHN|nr:TonB-dependent receptor [Novosphingobium album (ex Liu et al. 2023)]MDE8653923.1 TonB-dependent receptor [Novosphingobium album (ex Liu et al. 2023)]
MAAAIAWSGANADAREARPARIDISAASLPDAIAELSREARVSIGTEGALPRLRSRLVRGEMSVGEALTRLLAGTGYRARQVGETAWRIERAPPSPAPPARAEPAPAPPPPPPPEPIVVTGTKRALDLLALPMAVSVVGLDADQSRDPAAGTATIADELEGLSLTSLGPGRNRMFLRGVADSPFNGESQSTVAVVLDEARLTYAAPDPDVRLVDIERIEVLKGPQGSLYGTGALGGVYHLVARPAQPGETSLAISGAASVVARGGAGYSGSAIANLPLAGDSVGLRLVGYTALEPGWIDTGARRDSNSTRVAGARAMVGIEAGGGWRADLTGFAQWLNSRDSRYVYAPHARTRPAQAPEPHDNDLRHLAGRLTGAIGGISVLLASAMTWHEVGDTLDATIGAAGFDLADPRLLADSRNYRVWDSELRLRGEAGRLGWLLGFSHLAARQAIDMTLTGAGGAGLAIDSDRRTAFDTAAYADLTLPLTGRLSIEAGGRLFRAALRERRRLVAGDVARERHKSGLTPSAAIAWQPDPHRLLYLRYGSAFRQGGSDIAPGGTIETLKGDELATIEAGWRQRLSGGGRIELGVWYTWWENIQSDLLREDGLIETGNAGNGRIFGAEASAEVSIGAGWRLEAGADVTSAKLTRNDLGYELDDSHLPVVPDYTFRAALRRDFTLGGVDAWARARLNYIGPARMSFDPALDRPMGKVFESEFEAHAALGALDMAITARNLLGGRGNTFAFGNSLRYRTMAQFTPQQPFTATLSLALAF